MPLCQVLSCWVLVVCKHVCFPHKIEKSPVQQRSLFPNWLCVVRKAGWSPRLSLQYVWQVGLEPHCTGLALDCGRLSVPGLIFTEISALEWLWSMGKIGHNIGSSYRYRINIWVHGCKEQPRGACGQIPCCEPEGAGGVRRCGRAPTGKQTWNLILKE